LTIGGAELGAVAQAAKPKAANSERNGRARLDIEALPADGHCIVRSGNRREMIAEFT
jgi:hypothetical protein